MPLKIIGGLLRKLISKNDFKNSFQIFPLWDIFIKKFPPHFYIYIEQKVENLLNHNISL